MWEVISANPAVLQDISFGVAISAQTASPGQGAVTAVGGLGPIEATSAQDTIPLFKDVAKAIPAFAVSNLLTVPSLKCLSAASYLGPDAAPGSIVAAFGTNLAAIPAMATEITLPSTLSGVTVELIDTTGSKKVAPLLFVSASQINFVATNDLEPGPVLVNVLNGTRLDRVRVYATATCCAGLFREWGWSRRVRGRSAAQLRFKLDKRPGCCLRCGRITVEAASIEIG